ncbi:MAG: hypothetical protein AAGM67_15195 [Bacteroidota bacterium]
MKTLIHNMDTAYQVYVVNVQNALVKSLKEIYFLTEKKFKKIELLGYTPGYSDGDGPSHYQLFPAWDCYEYDSLDYLIEQEGFADMEELKQAFEYKNKHPLRDLLQSMDRYLNDLKVYFEKAYGTDWKLTITWDETGNCKIAQEAYYDGE